MAPPQEQLLSLSARWHQRPAPAPLVCSPSSEQLAVRRLVWALRLFFHLQVTGLLSFLADSTARVEPAYSQSLVPLFVTSRDRDSDRHRTPARSSMARPRSAQPQLSSLPTSVKFACAPPGPLESVGYICRAAVVASHCPKWVSVRAIRGRNGRRLQRQV